MIINKHNYTAISRKHINGQRLYTTPDGSAVPSVTTILDKTKPQEARQALENWKRRVGHTQAAAITKEAAGRGTRMHKWLEDYVKSSGELGDPGSNPYSQQSHKMAQLVIDKGLSQVNEFWGLEVPLYFPQIYAGTTDCVGVHKNTESILDFKQTNKPKRREWIEDYFMQLCAYAEAHNEVYGTNIRKGVVLMCSADFQYQEFIIEGDEFDEYKRRWWARVGEFYGA